MIIDYNGLMTMALLVGVAAMAVIIITKDASGNFTAHVTYDE